MYLLQKTKKMVDMITFREQSEHEHSLMTKVNFITENMKTQIYMNTKCLQANSVSLGKRKRVHNAN